MNIPQLPFGINKHLGQFTWPCQTGSWCSSCSFMGPGCYWAIPLHPSVASQAPGAVTTTGHWQDGSFKKSSNHKKTVGEQKSRHFSTKGFKIVLSSCTVQLVRWCFVAAICFLSPLMPGTTEAQVPNLADPIKYDPNKYAAIMGYGWIHPTQFCWCNMQESSRSFFFSSCKLSIWVCNRASLATVGTRMVLERSTVSLAIGQGWHNSITVSVDVRMMHNRMQIWHDAYCFRTTLQEQRSEGHTHSTTTWWANREWRYTAAHHRGTHLTSPSLAFLQSQPCPVSNLVAFSQMQQLALLDLGYDTRFGNMGTRIVLKNRMSCEETSMEPQNHITMLHHPVTRPP